MLHAEMLKALGNFKLGGEKAKEVFVVFHCLKGDYGKGAKLLP